MLFNQILNHSSPMQGAVGKMVAMREGTQGLSHTTFLQDTAVGLLPKSAVSRSKTELAETTFLELLESGLVYYIMPLAGSGLFKRLFHKAAGSGKAGFSHLNVPVDRIPKAELARVLPVRAGIILSTLGAALFGGEYVINYGKNLMTTSVFKQDRFSDVVNLSEGTVTETGNSPVARKAKERIGQALLATAGILGGSLVLARFGGRIPKLQGPLRKLVKTFDFNIDGKGGYHLGRNQLLAFMGLSVPAYLDAARDGLERMEVASRLALILPYLAFGQGFLEKGLSKLMGRKFPEIVNETGGIKSLKDLMAEAAERAAQKVGNGNESALLKQTVLEMRRPLLGKNLLFGIPLAVGILGTGLGVSLMNRCWTAYRFKKQSRVSVSLPSAPVMRKSFQQYTQPRV